MKNVLIGVTGGISAYKSANIVSKLMKKGYNVRVIMTENATKIIAPLTLETLSKNRVYVDMWDEKPHYDVEHISLATWADVMLVAPATYNIVGKVANGIADDMLSTVISACTCPTYFALAMNVNMYNNPILKSNIKKLEGFGYKFIDSDEGFLACNVNAKGRLKDEDEIISIIEGEQNKDGKLSSEVKDFTINSKLKGKKVLITAGRTEEAIDPVRYLSNRSSGKMGYSLAKAALDMGADVILVSGPTNLEVPAGVECRRVTSAQEMYEVAIKEFPNVDIAIACAAVADYRPKVYSSEKIKKKDGDLVIELVRNPDILFEMGKIKKDQFLVGFAAETQNLKENALGKLKKKNLDMIVGNNANNMQKSTNEILIIKNEDDITECMKQSKEKLAYVILESI